MYAGVNWAPGRLPGLQTILVSLRSAGAPRRTHVLTVKGGGWRGPATDGVFASPGWETCGLQAVSLSDRLRLRVPKSVRGGGFQLNFDRRPGVLADGAGPLPYRTISVTLLFVVPLRERSAAVAQ
ncbi:hypothetical protein CATMQ487_41730 [Sphaerotilus microaerophilus]|uniref:Uncharacterized protein n=1 Tax=Sphaerotilus microaerophilus TaxID=2914710 RepID=A0ABM7YRK4_9BURK|nr:hypothetical protein CATMQ487_41730 [Sphaerotilus sp. FB-5]